MDYLTRVVLGLLVVVLLATSGAAQELPTTGNNTTAANATTTSPTTVTTTAPNQSHWTGGGGGGGLISFDPLDYLTGLLGAFGKLATGSVMWLFRQIIDFLVGVNHPVNNGPMGIFGTPTNQPYKALFWQIYIPVTIGFAGAVLIMLASVRAAVSPFTGLISSGRQSAITVAVMATVVWFTLWWPLSTFVEMFVDTAANAIAPSPKQMTSSFGSLVKLGSAPIIGGVTFAAIGWIEMVVLAMVYKLIDTALLVYKVGMPILITGAYLGPHRRMRSLCSSLAWQWLNFVTMSLPMAFILLVSWTLKWSISLKGLGAVLTSIALLLIGIFYPLYSTYLTSKGGMERLSRKTVRKTQNQYKKFTASDDDEDSGVLGRIGGRFGRGTAADGGTQRTLGDYSQSSTYRDRFKHTLRRKP
ncbi:hypothetical protein [Haladaptatus halobius]|uniref:hypothetical protein n=1 Tax=Haladaptatus halobius TaxID=2884875 RepID=UPI001D09AEDC|nr:hypothetical protein [Haladaptatus halobius]